MITLTADEKMLAVLNQVKELAEICDSAGKVIGFFAPIAIKQAQHYANAAAHIDPEDVRRAKEEKGPNRTTAEVLERCMQTEKPAGTFSELVQRLKVLTEESNRRRAAGEQDFTFDEAHAWLGATPGPRSRENSAS